MAISVRNSMNAATSPGTGPKMKKARRIAISPKSNCRYGIRGKFRPSACESVVRTTASAPKTADPAYGDAVEPSEPLAVCTAHPGTADFNKNLVVTKKMVIAVTGRELASPPKRI